VGLRHCIILCNTKSSTYDHRVWKTGLPVRSAVLKPHAGELVVGWVTTSESSLLYVFCFIFYRLSHCVAYIEGQKREGGEIGDRNPVYVHDSERGVCSNPKLSGNIFPRPCELGRNGDVSAQPAPA
ncbi:L-lysine 2-3-aminomutase, partial [Penicillium fimorum]